MNEATDSYRRAWEIAANARRFRLLARRPELQSPDRRARARHALVDDVPPGALHLFDAALIFGASELDRLCGYAVAVISSGGKSLGTLLDVLSVLEPDRICSIYYALPDDRRQVVLLDYAFSYYVGQVDEDEVAHAAADLEALIDGTPTSSLAYALARVDVAEDGTERAEAIGALAEFG